MFEEASTEKLRKLARELTEKEKYGIMNYPTNRLKDTFNEN